jgi:hypothetical protein
MRKVGFISLGTVLGYLRDSDCRFITGHRCAYHALNVFLRGAGFVVKTSEIQAAMPGHAHQSARPFHHSVSSSMLLSNRYYGGMVYPASNYDTFSQHKSPDSDHSAGKDGGPTDGESHASEIPNHSGSVRAQILAASLRHVVTFFFDQVRMTCSVQPC